MRFKATAISPKGRNKYGSYLSSKNVTRKVVSASYGGDNTNNSTSPVTPPTTESGNTNTSFTLALSKTSGAFDGLVVAVSAVTDSVNVISYMGMDKANAYVGPISSTTAAANYGITGLPSTGMAVAVSGNGTNDVTINVTVNSALTVATGTLKIPANIYLQTNDTALGDDISAWNSQSANCKTIILEYAWSLSQNADSTYKLDLTNENTSINCDKDGNILSGATRPTCTAVLYYGSQTVSGAVYAISYSSQQSVSGVSINTSTGVLTFGSNFSFAGTSLEIVVTASMSNSVVGTDIMTVTKAYPGADGSPATSYWLTLSTKAVHVDKDYNISPSSITASAMMQIGQDTPIAATGCTIYYGKDVDVPATVYTGAVTVTTANTQVVFSLKKGTQLVDGVETIPVLKDGQNGSKGDKGDTGDQGRQGAAMRGPVNWYTASEVTSRRWCNGQLTSTSYPDDVKWIDIILKDNHYYYCNTSYNEAGAAWSSVSAYWTQADSQLAFIATQLLLATNAKINFLTNNELYLLDTGGTVTAGAAGGNGISFWAGSDEPSDAPFQVNYDGSIKATSGTFAGFINCPYVNSSDSGISTKSGTTRTLNSNYSYICLSDSTIETYVLPAPCAALNGFTYNLLNLSFHQRAGSTGYTHAYLTTSGGTRCFYKYTDFIPESYDNLAATKLEVSAGYYQLVCTGVGNRSTSYNWYLIQASGTAVPYNGTTKLASGYSVRSEQINNIDSDVDDTTMYLIH